MSDAIDPDRPGPEPEAVPFGFTFEVDHGGRPIALGPGRCAADIFGWWITDYDHPAEIGEHLEAIDDVVAGRSPTYHCQSNDTVVLVEPAGFVVVWNLPGVSDTPHYRGTVAQLRRLLALWAEHLERIGWKGAP